MRDKIISFKANPESVDMEARIIRNAILAQVGAATGHGFSVEQKFINDLVSQSSSGILSNFGHNYDNMGLQLGRMNDVKVVGTAAKGNLSIYANADNSPQLKGMGSWVLNQAKEDPESIMLSIRFNPSHYYQYDDLGQSVTCRQDWWGDPIQEFKDRPVFVGLRKLVSVDVVDNGALTDKMFSQDKGFLQKLIDFIKKDKKDMTGIQPGPDDVDNNGLNQTEGGGTNDGSIIWVGDKQFKAADITTMLEEITALKSGDGEMRSKIDLLTQKVGQLEAENTELKAQPAAVLTNGETGSTPNKKMTTADKFNAAINASLQK